MIVFMTLVLQQRVHERIAEILGEAVVSSVSLTSQEPLEARISRHAFKSIVVVSVVTMIRTQKGESPTKPASGEATRAAIIGWRG